MMTNSIYLQIADSITPFFGIATIDEAKDFTPEDQQRYLIETADPVYMNPETGSVGFESDWDDLSEVVEVVYDIESESWVKN